MKKVLVLIGIVMVVMIGGCAIFLIGASTTVEDEASTTTISSKEVTVEPSEDSKKETKKKDKSTLTLKKFNQLKTDMSYKEVVQILGTKGEVMSESEVAGIKTVLYTWDGSFGANMNATFQNDKLISKAQVGLK